MNLCILCDDANVIEARERCISAMPVVDTERLNRVLAFKRSIIEEGVPSEFLAKHGLLKIKTY